MAAARPIWRGQLRLSLVSINVEMFPAHKSGATTSFNQIHAPTGKRIHYQKVVDGVGPVPADEIRKGYEYEKGEYVLLEDDELDAVKLETKKTLDLVQFVDEAEIPPLYYDSAYFLVPADELAEDAFRVVRDALRKSKRVGLGQLALRGKEYLVAIRPCGKGMLLETLHYQEEIRKSDSFFSEIPAKSADPDLLEVATALIDKKTAKFDPTEYKNHYQAALRELIQRKLKSKGRRIEVEEEKPRQESGNVIDLMAALKKSLESGERTPAKSAARKAPAKKAPAKKAAAKAAPRRKAS
ncbi:MAG: Ku protein [Devosia sp. 67-54]|uniref:non-homologous end joining protein Ku n=1 Tax=unclassified Devosia TaxID=196773 RepID=UPI0009599E26|nr:MULTISPECIES: Ku protein [unclassified Devosia]MBN9305795.1 Ku protein [Devosia sp.]OJX16498.1 MAG: Ku protein [Devosia sp. 67-54]